MNNFNHVLEDPGLRLNRRTFFARTSLGLGSMALASLLAEHTGAGEGAADVAGGGAPTIDPAYRGILAGPHHAPKAKRIIATVLSLLGIDHERLTFKHQGRYYRLTDIAGKVVKGILA
jgi:Protein of unknown function (DUF1501)